MAAILEARLVSPHATPPSGDGISELIGNSFLGAIAKKVGSLWDAHKAKKAEQEDAKLFREIEKEAATRELVTFITKNQSTFKANKTCNYDIYAEYSASKVSSKFKDEQWTDARNAIMWKFTVKEREKMVQEAKKRVNYKD